MDIQRVDMFIMSNAKYFEQNHLPTIRKTILELDENKFNSLTTIQFKDPGTSLIISILGGSLGIDRFIIGDVGIGIGKLLTCGGLGIWAIVDIFLIQAATRNKNLELLKYSLR